MHNTLDLIRPEDVIQMQDEQTLIDQGLTRGFKYFERTTGVSVSPHYGYDVAAVAVVRLLQQLPHHVTVSAVLEGLQRRAVSLDTRSDEPYFSREVA